MLTQDDTIQPLCNQVKNKLWLTHLEEYTHHLDLARKTGLEKNNWCLNKHWG